MNRNILWSVAIIILLLGASITVSAQSSYLPLGNPAYGFLDRLELKSGTLKNDLFLDIKPLDRQNIADYIHQLHTDSLKLTSADRYWLDYLQQENLPLSGGDVNSSNKPILRHFYKSKANLFQVTDSNFNLFVNPVLAFGVGVQADSPGYRFRNTRGIEIRGNIDKKVGFYTYLTENQVSYPAFVEEYRKQFKVLPGQTFIKPFKNSPAYDFFTARGYITFSATRHIHLQFGQDQNVLGNGYRSLLLSDFAPSYLFLKVNTRIWRFQYQNLFCQLQHDAMGIIKPYPKHYAAFHYLSFDAAKWINFGVFEGIMFYDQRSNGRGFDFSYLNPIIFYRSVEHSMGSPDNALVGANLNILPVRKLKLYGQLLFDEFYISHLRKMDNSWVNKYALQAGLKWVDVFGLPNIDIQGEVNLVRPYTYSEDTFAKSYSHFNEPLAHPMGANLREMVGIVSINTYAPLLIQLKYIFLQQGKDTANTDFGGNILLSYNRRPGDVVPLLQGVLTTTSYFELLASYQLRHNLFIDATALYRHETSTLATRNTLYIGGGLRFNFAYPNYQF